MNDMSRRAALGGALGAGGALLLAACRNPFSASDGASDDGGSGPVVFGVSVPLTGDNAEYGAIWKRAFRLALDEANSAGGVKGRKFKVDLQDSGADPKQAVTIAEKFASDKRVIAELGDFASPASMAASSVYERARLVQFGITNSHPDFTKGGEYMWSNATSQEDSAKAQQTLAHQYGDRQAVLYLDTDWGKTVWKIYQANAEKHADTITHSSGFLSGSTDFRPMLIKARASKPDVLAIIGYYKDAALITQQARSVGFDDTQIVVSNSAYSPQFLKLGGDATEEVRLATEFTAENPAERVQKFTKKWKARYGHTPDSFAAGAYDAVNILIWAARKYGPTRAGIQEGLQKGKAIPSVVTGPFAFGEDRRAGVKKVTRLLVKDGRYVVDGAE